MKFDKIIREMFDAIDSNEFDKLADAFDESAIYERPGYPTLTGLGAILDYYKQARIIASGRHDIDRLVVDHSSGCCWGTFSGVSHQGTSLNERYADCYYFENGKIKRRITHFFRPAI